MTFGTQVLLSGGDMSQNFLYSLAHNVTYRKEAAFVCQFLSGAPTGTLQMLGCCLLNPPVSMADPNWAPMLAPYTITGVGVYTFDITSTGFLWLAVRFAKSGSSNGSLFVNCSSKGQG